MRGQPEEALFTLCLLFLVGIVVVVVASAAFASAFAPAASQRQRERDRASRGTVKSLPSALIGRFLATKTFHFAQGERTATQIGTVTVCVWGACRCVRKRMLVRIGQLR